MLVARQDALSPLFSLVVSIGGLPLRLSSLPGPFRRIPRPLLRLLPPLVFQGPCRCFLPCVVAARGQSASSYTATASSLVRYAAHNAPARTVPTQSMHQAATGIAQRPLRLSYNAVRTPSSRRRSPTAASAARAIVSNGTVPAGRPGGSVTQQSAPVPSAIT